MRRSQLALFLIFAMLLSACGNQVTETTVPEETNNPSPLETETITDSAENAASVNTDTLFSERDYITDYDEAASALIEMQGDTARCSSDAVIIDGSTITITDEGTYILTGTLDNGMIIVNSEKTDKTQLVLKDAAIHSETSAPIYVLQSDKVFITTVEDTENILSNGGSFEQIDENNIDSVIFSKEDLTLNGKGNLIVTSPAGHGIVSKDSLTITSGSYDINCASHALTGKDDVSIADGTFTIVSGKDGIHGENADDTTLGSVSILNGSYSIRAEGDGISASANLLIQGGTFDITTGGGSTNAEVKTSEGWGGFMGGGKHGGKDRGMGGSMQEMPPSGEPGSMDPSAEDTTDSTSIKGIKAETDLTITGGSFTIDSADDSIHSNGNVNVTGGTFAIASGDDAFHAEENLTIAGGTMDISTSYEGLEGLHILVSGGDISLIASDDGINAAGGTDTSGFTGGRDGMFSPGMMGGSSDGSITISGGNVHVTASGDGLDANGTIAMTGGYVTVCGPIMGDTATLDYDSTAVISGGTFIGTGASGMAQTFSDSSQGVIAVSVGSLSAGTEIKLTDAQGNSVIAYTAPLDFSVVILSTADMIKGETYTMTVGENSADFAAN